ncbi:MAG: ParB/RepB/Spo0J family partition protein [Alphaproteobacteria bacterium]|nr:ParB/RepB/Spo0J family partition protein [Alphaproteobacteria bacterium]
MSDDSGPRRGANKLGRGLSALLGDEDEDHAQLERLRQTRSIPVERLSPGPFQPRRRFDRDELEELAESIREQGVLQPILVRRDPTGEDYQIIAGERRWRAAQLAQLHEVPVLVREFDDRTAMEIALVENIQRRDLGPLEEAEGYRRLTDEYGHSQEEIGRAVGKSRSHIANTMRLLNLPDDVRGLLDDGQLSAGHARALLGAENAEALAREVVTRKLNVRETERLVQRARDGVDAKPRAAKPPSEKDADTLALERALRDQLGLPVSVDFDPRTGAGSVTVRYADLDQLDLVVARLSGAGGREAVPGGVNLDTTRADSDIDSATIDDENSIPAWSFDDDNSSPTGIPPGGTGDDATEDDENDEDQDDPLVPQAG